MDSVEEGTWRVELESLLKQLLPSGFKSCFSCFNCFGYNLDMSSDLGLLLFSLYGSDIPFMELINFPQKLNILLFRCTNLQWSIYKQIIFKCTTTINVPISGINGDYSSLNINNGYGYASFDLPDSSSNYISVGLDTNGNSLFGLALSVVDTSLSKEMLSVALCGSNWWFLCFLDYVGSEIKTLIFREDYWVNNLEVSGWLFWYKSLSY